MNKEYFYIRPLTEEIKKKITGISYPEADAEISCDELAYVHVRHWDFGCREKDGELICNRKIADELVDIFKELHHQKYPVEKIRLVDAYGADDEASMADNNSSCFNYRTVAGTSQLSNHAYGLAVDINPRYNPYITYKNGGQIIAPANACIYADRSADFQHKIDENDLCYRLFTEHGFSWGGAWTHAKDYQHFEKTK